MNIVNNWLNKHYYFNNDGKPDEIADSLGDCMIQCAYVILKNKYGLNSDFYKCFLNETTIKLCVSESDNIEMFETIENVFDKEIFSLYGFEKINEKAVDKISEILKAGDIPAVATVVEKLRFSVFYDENYKQNRIRTRHVFIIVGEDSENFYFIDNPGVISYKNYLGLCDNKEIGIISKKDFYDKNAEVHFIGHLQTNKVKYIIDSVSMIQSVDSIKLAEEIDRHAGRIGKCQDILIEVNIGGEKSKSGIAASGLEELVYQVSELENIRVRGLMAIPPAGSSERFLFDMQKLYIDISQKKIHNISMGMSGDYEAAIKYGANMVRIGRGLFGPRNY